MDILQIGDIVRISDSVAEDPLEDWSFVIYNRHVNTSKRIANAGQFGCVTGRIRIGLTDDIYVFVVPCQKDFDFLQDRHALRHVEGFPMLGDNLDLPFTDPTNGKVQTIKAPVVGVYTMGNEVMVEIWYAPDTSIHVIYIPVGKVDLQSVWTVF